MELKDLEKKLENLKTPEIEIQSHKQRLKMALLNSGYFKEKTSMSLLKKFAPIGAVAVIALLVVVGVNYFKNPSSVSNLSLTPAAYAKELVKKSAETLAGSNAVPLPTAVTCIIEEAPKGTSGTAEIKDGKCVIHIVEWKTTDADGNIRDEKGNIVFITTPEGEIVPAPKEKPSLEPTYAPQVDSDKGVGYTFTKDSFKSFLDEAKKASDLTYLGDKILSENKFDGQRLFRVKVLRFTDEKGSTTILGLDENNYPVVRLAYTKDGGAGGVMFGSGEIRGETPVSFDLEDQIKYWTENLEQPTDFKAIQK